MAVDTPTAEAIPTAAVAVAEELAAAVEVQEDSSAVSPARFPVR